MKKNILGFAGEMASGKGTCATYLSERYGAKTYRFSTVLRDIVKRLSLPEDRSHIQRTSTALRKEFGSDLLARVIFKDVQKDQSNILVVDGVRRLEDIKYLRELQEFKLVYVTAPMKTRYERLVRRGENEDDKTKTFEEFENDHKRETEIEITALEPFASDVIDNSGTLPDLHHQLDQIIKKYGG